MGVDYYRRGGKYYYTITAGNGQDATESLGNYDIGSAYVSGQSGSGGGTAGILTSTAGGVISNANVWNNAYAAAANGGQLVGGVANSGASLDAMNGGTLFGGTAASSGAIATGVLVDNNGSPLGGRGQGGQVYDPTVLSGGYALAGGAPNLVVKGYRVQGSGGLISGGNFMSGSTTVIGNGGTYLNGTYDGMQWVQSNAQGTGGIFSGSGATQLNNGGVVTRSTAMNGGLVNISGARGTNLTAMSGGTVRVQGGTYQGVLDNGIGNDPAIGSYSKGSSFGNTVQSGGTEIIASDGTATSSHIYTNGQGTVLEGGVAMGVDVNGGTEVVSSGGLITSGSAANGGLIDLEPQGSASSLVASSGGSVLVNGGTVNNTLTVAAGGTGDITSGGSVNNYLINNNASASVHNGNVNSLVVNGGTGQVYQGGSINNYTVNSNGIGYLNSGAQANNFLANAGSAVLQTGGIANTLSASGVGTAFLEKGGFASNAIATNNSNGGGIILGGSAANVSATNGGIVSAVAGGEAGSFNINGGTGFIYAGYGLDSPPSVSGNGGVLNLESGLTIDRANAFSGGTLLAHSGVNVAQNLLAGAGGTAIAENGANGNAIIASGANAHGTALSGANFQGIQVNDGGSGVAASGASLNWMSITSGDGTLLSGATVRHLQIQAGGSGVLLPGASAMKITVNTGGWVSGATVTNGNSMSVASGATAVNTYVADSSADASHDQTEVLSGGSAINTNIAGAAGTDALGGLLTIESGANLQHTSMGYNARIRIVGLKYDGGGTTFMSGGTLHVIENGQEWTTTLQGNYHGKTTSDSGFILLDDGQGNTIVVYDQCFLAGTLIRLESGEVTVETLKAGDKIRTLVNGHEEIREIASVMKRHATVHTDLPEDMAGWSVKISKDAFSSGVPSQDLSVTPEHCFYLNGRFVPARMLVNGQTIYYDHSQVEYDFYHVETHPHSIIWANNTLTESYLNTGERPFFKNDENNVAHLTPREKLTWDNDAAAPLEVSQSFVEPLFKEFQQRAQSLETPNSVAPPIEHKKSDDPNLRLQLEDGTIIKPTRRINNRFLFSFPIQKHSVKVLSRRFKPSESIGPFVDDRRTLGVLVSNLELWIGGREHNITQHLENNSLKGWDVMETGPHRWTRGNAVIPLPDQNQINGGMNLLSIQVEAGGPYILSTADTMQEIAAS